MSAISWTFGRELDPASAVIDTSGYLPTDHKIRFSFSTTAPHNLVVQDLADGTSAGIMDWTENVWLARDNASYRLDFSDHRAEVELTGGSRGDVLRGGLSSDILSGGAGHDLLEGGAGNDILEGGEGYDRLIGGTGNNTASYAGAKAGVSVSLASPVLNTGEAYGDAYSQIQNVRGSAFGDTLYGDTLDNVIEGGAGADAIYGGGGFDTASYEHARSAVIANLTLGGTLGDANGDDYLGVEHLTGSAFNDQLTGNGGVNRLTGGSGNDRLDGGAGADTMIGGFGNDLYIIDNAGDVIQEATDGGTDAVQSSISFAIGIRSIEAVTLTGSAHINASGSALANTLVGNAGNNILNGGAGADTMTGGAGDDTFVVDNVGDKVFEAVTGGNDTVQSTVSFDLSTAPGVEDLILTGSAAVNATGNSIGNNLVGNSAANVLDGKGSADVMDGGGGNDTYVVDDVGDRIIEAAGGGTDLVISSATEYSLESNMGELENLTLTGNAVKGVGSELANIITGSHGDNGLWGGAGNDRLIGGGGNDVLEGGVGNDTLVGGLGRDTLVGGVGQDVFVFNTARSAGNVDMIRYFDPLNDTIQLDPTLFSGLPAGALNANAFTFGVQAQDTSDRIIFDGSSLYFDRDGSGTAYAPELFATLSLADSRVQLTAADFWIG